MCLSLHERYVCLILNIAGFSVLVSTIVRNIEFHGSLPKGSRTAMYAQTDEQTN